MSVKIITTAERYKKSTEVLDYDFDYTEFLGADNIASSDITSTPSGLTLGTKSNTTKVQKQWISGGTIGVIYSVKCAMTSTGGRVKTLEVLLTIIA